MELIFIISTSVVFILYMIVQEALTESWAGPKYNSSNEASLYLGMSIIPNHNIEKGKLYKLDEKVFVNPHDYLVILREMRLEQTIIGRMYIRYRKRRLSIKKTIQS